jgi:transposase-like protein
VDEENAGGQRMKPICTECNHNMSRDFGGKRNQPTIKNKPKAVCWCSANGGRMITKKYMQCKFFEMQEGKA